MSYCAIHGCKKYRVPLKRWCEEHSAYYEKADNAPQPSQAGREPQMLELEHRATNAAYRTWDDLVPLVNFIGIGVFDTKQKAIEAIKMRFIEQFEVGREPYCQLCGAELIAALKPPAAPLEARREPHDLLNTFDGKVWAEEFTRIAKSKGIEIDEDWMHTWFANAIMTGHDYALRRAPAAPLEAEGLEKLVAKWREEASDNTGCSSCLLQCAYELEAALARTRQVPPADFDDWYRKNSGVILGKAATMRDVAWLAWNAASQVGEQPHSRPSAPTPRTGPTRGAALNFDAEIEYVKELDTARGTPSAPYTVSQSGPQQGAIPSATPSAGEPPTYTHDWPKDFAIPHASFVLAAIAESLIEQNAPGNVSAYRLMDKIDAAYRSQAGEPPTLADYDHWYETYSDETEYHEGMFEAFKGGAAWHASRGAEGDK